MLATETDRFRVDRVDSFPPPAAIGPPAGSALGGRERPKGDGRCGGARSKGLRVANDATEPEEPPPHRFNWSPRFVDAMCRQRQSDRSVRRVRRYGRADAAPRANSATSGQPRERRPAIPNRQYRHRSSSATAIRFHCGFDYQNNPINVSVSSSRFGQARSWPSLVAVQVKRWGAGRPRTGPFASCPGIDWQAIVRGDRCEIATTIEKVTLPGIDRLRG